MPIPCAELWGDSIGRGIAYDEARGRYAVLRPNYTDILADKGLVTINNHARFGASVSQGLEDFLQTRQLEGTSVLIQYGGNDCNFSWNMIAKAPEDAHSPATPLDLFEKTLRQFVKAVRSRGKQPILVTPPPLDAGLFFAWVTKGLDAAAVLRFIGDIEYIYRWQERYAIAVHRVANATRAKVFDARDAFLGGETLKSLLCVDGMHPNEKGHELIARAAEAALPGLLSIAARKQAAANRG